jgi:hypothetical protein
VLHIKLEAEKAAADRDHDCSDQAAQNPYHSVSSGCRLSAWEFAILSVE